MRERMLSIDVLRGMTICFMIIVNTPGSWLYVWSPLKHAEWHGCTPTDLVFPSFLFVIGLSMAFSLGNSLEEETFSKKVLAKIVKRAAIIFLIGLLLNWFPFYYKHISNLRIFGVLQRIALAYLVAGLVITILRKNQVVLIGALVLMIVHWWILLFFGDSEPFSLNGNVSGKIDLFFFNETHIYKGFGIRFDPEGLLGTLSSAAHIIIGYLTSRVFIVGKMINFEMVRKILILSVILLVVGILWSSYYPINKPLWTGSYVLYTCGIIGLVLAFLIWLIDLVGIKKWTYPFKVFGLNPLLSFVFSILLVKIFLYIFRFENGNLYALAYKSFFQPVFGNYLGSFLFAVVFTAIIWFFSFLLYRKGKVVKI